MTPSIRAFVDAAVTAVSGGTVLRCDESGRPEIYVQTYPSGEHRVPVSTGGGVRPAWSPDGRQLYFVTRDAVAVVRILPDGSFDAPRKLPDPSTFLIYDRFQSYSVSPRGQRLLMMRRDEGSVPRPLNVIVIDGPTGGFYVPEGPRAHPSRRALIASTSVARRAGR